MSIIVANDEQGSEAWLLSRAGVITASTFADAVSWTGGLTKQQEIYVNALRAGAVEDEALARAGYKKKPTAEGITRAIAGLPVGEPSVASNKLAATKAIERIAKQPYGNTDGGFYATERGHVEEDFTRMVYETRFGVIVEEAGLIKTEDGLFGASVDGMIGDEGTFEVKVPLDMNKVMSILTTGDLEEYMHQMQGGLWITGRKWCDFAMGIPDLACLNNGNELFVKRVYRDDDFIDDMVTKLWAFAGRVKRFEELLRKPFGQAEVLKHLAVAA